MRILRVADLEAKPGEKVSGYVHVIGAEFGIPVTLICGEKEGGTVLISGGVHNAEYVGIQAAMQLADELDPRKIAGNIIVIRLMNRTGFEHRTMSLTYEDGKNLNRVFPGNPNGTLSDRIAYTVVTEFFPKADYYVDLHCGDGFEGLVSYVYCTGAATPEVAAKSREMAEIAHVDYLVTSMCGTGGAYNYAGSMGIPSILLERGHSSRWCEDLVAEDVHDVKNILRHLRILRGKSHIHGKPPIEVSPVIYEDAPVSGCWYPAKQPGETFKEGEVLGRICDYFGRELFVYRAKMGGIILYQTISLCIMKDTPMVSYGTWDEDTQGKIEVGSEIRKGRPDLQCAENRGQGGFRILMDDFGSGYSSLNMLKEAPVDEIKLDMRFLSAADPYGSAEEILHMIITMGNHMKLSIIAEGVETEQQKVMLQGFGCNKAQGYFYARPMREAEYTELLRKEKAEN